MIIRGEGAAHWISYAWHACFCTDVTCSVRGVVFKVTLHWDIKGSLPDSTNYHTNNRVFLHIYIHIQIKKKKHTMGRHARRFVHSFVCLSLDEKKKKKCFFSSTIGPIWARFLGDRGSGSVVTGEHSVLTLSQTFPTRLVTGTIGSIPPIVRVRLLHHFPVPLPQAPLFCRLTR